MGSSTETMPRQQVEMTPRDSALSGVIWFAVLLAVCYLPILKQLINQWATDEDMGHGFFVPVLAGYIAWQQKDEILGKSYRSNAWGLLIMAFAAALSIAGTLGAELFTQRISFVFSVIGALLYWGGLPLLRTLAFPVLLLFFMIPIPAIVYNRITFPLQLIASQVAETALGLMGVPVVRDGNVLELPSQKLSVVEACSGIRSLLSLSFLSLIYGFFFETRVWVRWVLFFATVPIAITANAARVTLTGILSEINVEYSHGVYHSLSGWVVFVVAMVILVIFHQVLVRAYSAFKRA